MIEPLSKKHILNFVTGACLTGEYIMPERIKSAIEGLKEDFAKWDTEKIQGIDDTENKWDYDAIVYFIDKWFPLFIENEVG